MSLLINRGYRTISVEAYSVISGIITLKLLVEEKSRKREDKTKVIKENYIRKVEQVMERI